MEKERNPVSAENILNKTQNGFIPDFSGIPFPDPSQFVAGGIHKHSDQWEIILEHSGASDEVRNWVRNGVDMYQYIQLFEGTFWGEWYNADFPPPRLFNNANSCKQFDDFINSTIKERLQKGSIECIGRFHEVQPTHIVAPLTVEPTKPWLA